MVLDTTYFLGRERAGDAFYYFRLHLVHIAAGLVICVVISQFSLAGLRRLVMPLGVDRDSPAGSGMGSRAGGGAWARPALGANRSGAGRAFGTGEIRAGLLSRRFSRKATGDHPGIRALRASGLYCRGSSYPPRSLAARLRCDGDDRCIAVRVALCGRRTAEASWRCGRLRARSARTSGCCKALPRSGASSRSSIHGILRAPPVSS